MTCWGRGSGAAKRVLNPIWIPAFAGMTCWGGRPIPVTPAKAGVQSLPRSRSGGGHDEAGVSGRYA